MYIVFCLYSSLLLSLFICTIMYLRNTQLCILQFPHSVLMHGQNHGARALRWPLFRITRAHKSTALWRGIQKCCGAAMKCVVYYFVSLFILYKYSVYIDVLQFYASNHNKTFNSSMRDLRHALQHWLRWCSLLYTDAKGCNGGGVAFRLYGSWVNTYV